MHRAPGAAASCGGMSPRDSLTRHTSFLPEIYLSIYLSIYRAKLQHEDGEVVRPANWRGPSAPVICAQVPFYRKVGRS